LNDTAAQPAAQNPDPTVHGTLYNLLHKPVTWILTIVIGALITLGVTTWVTSIVYAEELKDAMEPIYEAQRAQTVAVTRLAEAVSLSSLIAQRANAQSEFMSYRMIRAEVSDWTARDQEEMDEARERVHDLDVQIQAQTPTGMETEAE